MISGEYNMYEEIEKLYNNARVEFKFVRPLFCRIAGREAIDWRENYHIDFNAEKQLAIVKWILERGGLLEVNKCSSKPLYDLPHTNKKFMTFEEALCADINYHWKFLTDLEKKQIQKILSKLQE